MSDTLGPRVLCKVKEKECNLVRGTWSMGCPLCEGHDLQASYYENHVVVTEPQVIDKDPSTDANCYSGAKFAGGN